MGWIVLLAMGWLETAAGSPTCLRQYGTTVCGFNCLAAHGQVACARTVRGVCAASGTGVVCWDPPPSVRAHYGDRTPVPRCITRAGHTECGYHCQAHDDDIACAGSPDGVCRATGLGVTCWDPSPANYCADDSPLPRPACVSLDDKVTCGYACEARNGQMACAATPGGVCVATPGGIVCSDVEPPPMCGDAPCDTGGAERPWCAPVTPTR